MATSLGARGDAGLTTVIAGRGYGDSIGPVAGPVVRTQGILIVRTRVFPMV
jgi:hypothetical protein